METVLFLDAFCTTHRKPFYLRYDLGADDAWVLTYGVKELPSGKRSSIRSGAELASRKRRTGPQYKCPWCGNPGFVRCGSCHKLSCWDGESEYFSCKICGYESRITGTISGEDLDENKNSGWSGQ